MQSEITRPRVSRETRRLLAAAGVALLTLWILARLRFPEQPSPPNPVTPVLTQISPPTSFADLAQETARIEERIAPHLAMVTWQAPGDERRRSYPASPWRDDLAIAMLPPASAIHARDDIRAVDPPTGLTLVRVGKSQRPAAPIWTAHQLDAPRYFFAATPAPARPAMAPWYVSALEPRRSPAWSSEIWDVTSASAMTPGALIFTAAGEFVGIAANENGQSVIVPPLALFDLAAQLNQPRKAAGGLGFQVQELDTTLAREIGVAPGSGVIIAWIDPHGAAATRLVPGDVIESINGAATPTAFAWEVHSSRLGAGEQAVLQVRRAGERHHITLILPPAPAVTRNAALGLTLVRVPGLGSRITQVAPHTAAARAGLNVGDIVTMAGENVEPSPQVVRGAFDNVSEGGAMVLAIRRGNTHRLVVLTR